MRDVDRDTKELELLQRGEGFLAAGEWKAAEEIYHQVVEQYPDSLPALLGLVNLYLRKGAVEQALEIHKKALAINPDSVQLLADCAKIQLAIGQKQEAIKNLERANRLDPNHFETLTQLAAHACSARNMHEGYFYYEQALQNFPFTPNHLLNPAPFMEMEQIRRYASLICEFALLPQGQLSLHESRFLGNLVYSLGAAGPIIEIGTLFGWSTKILVMNKSHDRELITVDDYSWNPLGLPPDTHFDITKRILHEATKEFLVKQLRVQKSEFYKTYEGPAPALVFFDTEHTYENVMEDIAWAKSVNAHIICGHDYAPHWPGVVRAVNECGGVSQQLESLWVLKKQ